MENDPASPDKISDPNEKVVERFLKYIKDPVQKKLALQAALPRKLNKDIVSQLVPSDADVTALFDWLKSRPFVQKRGGYWAYHSVVKKIMVQYQNDISQVEWETTHLTLANWYENRVTRLQTEGDRITWIKDGEWRLVLVEQYFHLLSTNYKVHIADFMQDVVLLLLYQQWVDIIPFAVSLVEVEKTMKTNEWGELLYRCVASLIAGKQEGALDFFKKLNTTTWIKERIFQSTLYCLQGVYEKDKINQLNCYAKAIESNPKNADAYFSQGTALESLNREEDALESYNKAIEFNPQFVMAYNNRGIVLDKLERKEEALKSYDKAIELNSNDAKVYNNRGNVLNKLIRKEEALESYDKAIELNPEYATPYYNRGNVLSSLGRKMEALKDYDKCIEIKCEDSKAHHNRGNALKSLDRKEEALESYDRAIELNPKEAGAYYNRGVLLSELDRKEEAFENYDKAIELNPNYAVAHNNQGMILFDLNRKKEALKHFDRAININPEFKDALYNRGILLESLDRKEEALASYEKIIELYPRSVDTYNKMALLLFQKSRLEEAIEVFQNVIKHSVEGSILAEINISFIKILQNKLEEAKDILDKVWLKTKQKEPFTAKNLGHYFILKKDESLAISYYQKCLNLPSKDQDMYQHLQDDYNLLKLEEKGVTPEVYQKIIMELKNEH